MADCRQCADYEWCAKNEECGMFKQKQMTNADRIRGMSDEELAKWLDLLVNRAKIYGENKAWLEDMPRYYTDWLDWLKQEVSTNG